MLVHSQKYKRPYIQLSWYSQANRKERRYTMEILMIGALFRTSQRDCGSKGNQLYRFTQRRSTEPLCTLETLLHRLKKGILDFLIHLGSKFPTNMSQFILKEYHPQTTHQMALSLGTVTTWHLLRYATRVLITAHYVINVADSS